jgi:hypothetical protein
MKNVSDYLETKIKEKSEIWAASQVEKIHAESKLTKKDFTPEQVKNYETVFDATTGKDQKTFNRYMRKLDPQVKDDYINVSEQKEMEERIELATRRIKSQEEYLEAISKFKVELEKPNHPSTSMNSSPSTQMYV